MPLSAFTPVLAVLLFAGAGASVASDAEGPRRPVIVELFTSEGCSSCPPADALLRKLDEDQPIPGALVIALSEHVDYWDRLGWKDPFSAPAFSRRQETYGRRFHLDSVYTPQVVIDGASEAIGDDTRRISAAIRESIKRDRLNVRISPLFKNSRGVFSVHVQVEPVEKRGAGSESRLMIALAENTVLSHVLRGENGGRDLKHVAVVRSLVDVGRVGPASTFDSDIALTGELEHWGDKRFIAFVQDQQNGRIQGAGIRVLSNTHE